MTADLWILCHGPTTCGWMTRNWDLRNWLHCHSLPESNTRINQSAAASDHASPIRNREVIPHLPNSFQGLFTATPQPNSLSLCCYPYGVEITVAAIVIPFAVFLIPGYLSEQALRCAALYCDVLCWLHLHTHPLIIHIAQGLACFVVGLYCCPPSIDAPADVFNTVIGSRPLGLAVIV